MEAKQSGLGCLRLGWAWVRGCQLKMAGSHAHWDSPNLHDFSKFTICPGDPTRSQKSNL